MKRPWSALSAAVWLLFVAHVQADPTTASVQQKLKDSGFYYGEITGEKDADTSAAIRRYQIRNGLKITGELTPETMKSLGVNGTPKSATPPPQQTPTPAPRNPMPPDTNDLRDYHDETAPSHNAPRTTPMPGYAPGPHGLTPETSGIFDGTPYEVAPPDLQRRVIIGAQTVLARRGHYRGAIDGAYGPEMMFAVRAFQSRFDLAQSGRLDMDTLGALGLLPGQQAPGIAPRHRPPVRRAPNGEPIYQPR